MRTALLDMGLSVAWLSESLRAFNLRSSPSTGRTWLAPEGVGSKCTLLANVFVTRLLYMPPVQVGLRPMSLSLYYAWQRGVHFLIEQPMSSARALGQFTVVLTWLCPGHVRVEAYGSVSCSEWREDWAAKHDH